MDLEALHTYLHSKKAVTEGLPFGPDVLVLKVMGKMFALVSLDDIPPRVNLKCDPEEALVLRDRYDAVLPGYHMNKKHWNTVILDGSIPRDEVMAMIDASYGLVVKGLTKAKRRELEEM